MADDPVLDDAAHETFTRRQYLVRSALLDGTNLWLAIEAVASTSIEHPEWDMDEERSWEEWERA